MASEEKRAEEMRQPDNGSGHGSRRRPPHGHGHGGMMPGEKANDFKGSMKKLLGLMSNFKFALITVFVFAIASTVFNIVGPKVLSTATTELFEGISAKIAGTGGIDFDAVGTILLITLDCMDSRRFVHLFRAG